MRAQKIFTAMMVIPVVLVAATAVTALYRTADGDEPGVLEPFIEDPVFTAPVSGASSDEINHYESIRPTSLFPTGRRPESLSRVMRFADCSEANEAFSSLEDTINQTYTDATQTEIGGEHHDWHWVDQRRELSRLDLRFSPDTCTVVIELQATD